MPNLLTAMFVAHIAAALYWLASSFLVAMAKGKGAEAQYRFQMIAAVITMVFGGALWGQLHKAGIGKMELILIVGALLAIAAAGIQGAMVGGSIRRLQAGKIDEATARARIRKGSRFTAALLALALFAMVGSYHI